jgi:NAD(P)-dependent dehydrogenase (short-subunit alcohol dehydrogenase family)
MEHDLVIGGSGMLAGLVRRLAAEGRQVTVIARGRERLQRLAAPNIHPLPLDYRDRAALEAGITRCIAETGPIARCVAWMHDDDLGRALWIARRVRDVYCQVLGSAAADPAHPDILAQWQQAFAPLHRPVLRLAVLGFVLQGGASRWLSDTEISAGVRRALESDEAFTIVGTVTPWSMRP